MLFGCIPDRWYSIWLLFMQLDGFPAQIHNSLGVMAEIGVGPQLVRQYLQQITGRTHDKMIMNAGCTPMYLESIHDAHQKRTDRDSGGFLPLLQ